MHCAKEGVALRISSCKLVAWCEHRGVRLKLRCYSLEHNFLPLQYGHLSPRQPCLVTHRDNRLHFISSGLRDSSQKSLRGLLIQSNSVNFRTKRCQRGKINVPGHEHQSTCSSSKTRIHHRWKVLYQIHRLLSPSNSLTATQQLLYRLFSHSSYPSMKSSERQ